MSVMMIRDENGVFQPVKTIRGGKGEKGDKGDKGDPGDTPEKGVDYWTAADRQQMVSDVLAALPNASGVNF